MRKHTIMTTSRASLCALGEYLQTALFLCPLARTGAGRHKKPSAIGLSTKCSMGCWASSAAPRPSRRAMARFVWIRRCKGPLGGRAVPSNRRLPAPCRRVPRRLVAQLSRVSWYYLKRYGQTPHHRYVELPVVGRCGGHAVAHWRRRPRGVSAPGWGATAARPAGKSCAGRRGTYREILHETLLRGKAAVVPALKTALEGAGNASGLDTGAAAARLCCAWRRLWDHRGAQLAAQSGVSGRGEDQPQWPRAEAPSGTRPLAADIESGPGDRGHLAAPTASVARRASG